MNFHKKPNLYVKHVTLNVSNIDKSIEFYTNVIGFKVLQKEERKAALTADGKTPLLLLEQPEQLFQKQPRTTGLYHFAILLPTRKDLGKFTLSLINKQIPVQGASDHAVSEALYMADPDGNGIEVYRDREAAEWEWNKEMVTMVTEPMDVTGVVQASNEEEWSGLPENTVMGHIHIHVSNLAESRAFYTKILPYDVVCEYGSQALFLATGNYHHHIGMNTWAGVGAKAPEKNSIGMKEYTVSIPDATFKEKLQEVFEESGITYEATADSVRVTDPSGNNIVLEIE